MAHFNPIIPVEKDNLPIPEVREWSLEKYRLLGSYCDIFTRGMKNLWKQLVYIDLFAGAGYTKINKTGVIYKSSPLIALSLPVPFTKYIFCEKDTAKCNALLARVKREYPNYDTSILNLDCNEATQKIIDEIPHFNKDNTLLTFCFVDPYSLNLHFKTIKELSESRLIDFLILQALHMDANRNLRAYMRKESSKIALYFDDPDWRDKFRNGDECSNTSFVRFLADYYDANMGKIGYKRERKIHQIRSHDKNLPLYYLSFYSKHDRGLDYFGKIQKRANQQYSLDL